MGAQLRSNGLGGDCDALSPIGVFDRPLPMASQILGGRYDFDDIVLREDFHNRDLLRVERTHRDRHAPSEGLDRGMPATDRLKGSADERHRRHGVCFLQFTVAVQKDNAVLSKGIKTIRSRNEFYGFAIEDGRASTGPIKVSGSEQQNRGGMVFPNGPEGGQNLDLVLFPCASGDDDRSGVLFQTENISPLLNN
jgi:hypothetical protein